jgi:hypothetical protein
MSTEPSPTEVWTLAATIEQAANNVDELRQRFMACPDTIRRTRFRLDDLAGELRRAAVGLDETATDLARAWRSRSEILCPAEWGVCLEHRRTLTSSGGLSRCIVCGRTWDYDRLGSPCGEPVALLVVDPQGAEQPMCTGHVVAIGDMSDWTVRPLANDGSS